MLRRLLFLSGATGFWLGCLYPLFAQTTAPAGPVAPVPGLVVKIVQPTERAVFQRNQLNEAQVPIICTADPDVIRVEARLLNRNAATPPAYANWRLLNKSVVQNQWSIVVSVASGWWSLEVRAQKTDKLVTSVIQRFGVGEVFVTCGQSNSANYGTPCQLAQDDRVSACSWMTGQWQHARDPEPGAGGRGGSPWPLLGDLLVKKYQVPVGFYCAGVGSTQVGDWLPTNGLYPRLRAAFKLAGVHGIRAVLWHQGESDSIAGTSADTYAERLSSIIKQSRTDIGFTVPWGIAIASFHPAPQATQENQTEVRAGQNKVVNELPMIFAGPDTDALPGSDRATSDHVHLNAIGLQAHAEGWEKALDSIIPTTEP